MRIVAELFKTILVYILTVYSVSSLIGRSLSFLTPATTPAWLLYLPCLGAGLVVAYFLNKQITSIRGLAALFLACFFIFGVCEWMVSKQPRMTNAIHQK